MTNNVGRIYSVATFALLASIISVNAHPPSMDGKYTTRKGKCKDEESIIRITPKTFSRYESNCKIVKDEPGKGEWSNGDDYQLVIKCDSEGEISTDKVWIDGPVSGNQLKIAIDSDGPSTHRWIYRCNGK